MNIDTNEEAETSYNLIPMPDLDTTLNGSMILQSIGIANVSESEPSCSTHCNFEPSKRAGPSTYSRIRKR
jgi:hypothetical protein